MFRRRVTVSSSNNTSFLFLSLAISFIVFGLFMTWINITTKVDHLLLNDGRIDSLKINQQPVLKLPIENVVLPITEPPPTTTTTTTFKENNNNNNNQQQSTIQSTNNNNNNFPPSPLLANILTNNLYDNFWWPLQGSNSYYKLTTPNEIQQFQLIRNTVATYVERHNRASYKGFQDEVKFISLSPAAQLANRLRATISVIILGILTDSLVTVAFDFYSPFHSLFESRLEKLISTPPSHIPPASINTAVENIPCIDFSTFKSGLLHFTHGQYQVELYLKNPSLKQQFKMKFGIENSVVEGLYQTIFSYLFVPVESVRNSVQTFMNEKFLFSKHLEKKYVIGIHIRAGHDMRPPLSTENWMRFLTCGTDLIPKHVSSNKDQIVFYIAADHQAARDRVVKLFGEAGYQVTWYGQQFIPANNVPGVQLALIDLLLLIKSNGRVLSPYSSYSEFASIMSRDPGLYVASDKNDPPFPYSTISKTTMNGACIYSSSIEPSFYKLDEFLMKQVKCKV
jgi:hypothetical protein